MIGILSTDNIADLKPLGDRILVEVSPLPANPIQHLYTCLRDGER